MGPPTDIISKLKEAHKIKTLVETGTYYGNTTYWASLAFEKVITIEYSELIYQKVTEKYNHVKNIEFLYGDTRDWLDNIVPQLDAPALFWLDAHWSGGYTYGEREQCPLIQEIGLINRSQYEHFILVDDARLFLSPPPSPNSAEQWPDITAVLGSLNSGRSPRYIVIIEDVIIAVPYWAKPLVMQYCQGLSTKLWEFQGELKEKKTTINSLSATKQTLNVGVINNAVNEGQGATFLGEIYNKMLDLQALCSKHSVTPRGLIHIGAHEGKEIELYQAMGTQQVLFIEANPIVFERLQANIAEVPNVLAVNCAISNQNGTVTLHVTSLDQSSSILPLKQHKEIYPTIKEIGQVTVQSRTLDTLLQELQLNSSDFNLLSIDIQGAELLALQGATNVLKYIEAINTEVNYEELYEGCVLIDELDKFLEVHGFERVATTTPYHPSWGDAFYVKKPIITMSTLGKNGRFANQVFQYAFLKIYAKEHNLRVETPAWIGQYLFGHSDSPILQQLPVVIEKSNELSDALIPNTKELFKNVDFWGYFQYNAKYYAQHKEFFRSLFKPVQTVAIKMQTALERLRTMGKTVVGLHLRRGDYGYGEFFIAPSEWYKKWLRDLWQTLDEPVLFIASDELNKVIDEFAEYNPVTARDLGVDLPQAEFYPDFYLLSQCNVVAISNSSFSFAACLLNEQGKFFFRPHRQTKKLIAFDPWDSEVIFRDIELHEPTPVSPQSFETVEVLVNTDSEVVSAPTLVFPLNAINLFIFPDWSLPEEILSLDLEKVMKTILNHPNKSHISLFIENSEISDEEANLILSSIIMNILMQDELNTVDAPEISLIGQLSRKEWEVFLPHVHYQILLENENKQQAKVRAFNFQSLELNELENMHFYRED
jgi:FkbM family methyltransferase